MLSSVIVTREMLVADSICIPAMEAFDEAFPNGSASLEQIANPTLLGRKWIGYFAVNASFLTEDIAMSLILKSEDPSKCYGEAAIRSHWVTPDLGPTLVTISDYPKVTIGEAAVRAHWVTSETGPAMIEKSSDPRYFSMFAIGTPNGRRLRSRLN